MSSITSRESDPFNKAITQSWTNQKKIYEHEIKKLKEEVTRYQEMLDNLQQKQLEGSLYKKGRNSLNKSGFDKFNHSNSKIILNFLQEYIIFNLQVHRAINVDIFIHQSKKPEC
jgi:hypothetical protein